MRKYRSLTGFLFLVFGISFIGSQVTMPAVEGWYQHIHKAAWTPPDYVFGPVWTLLYLMIAVSGWRVWQRLPGSSLRRRTAHPAMRLYGVQLLLNFLWSIVFFGMARPGLAAIDIVAMLVAIALTIRAFLPIDRMAAYLLIPYFLWVLYASTLNIAIVLLN